MAERILRQGERLVTYPSGGAIDTRSARTTFLRFQQGEDLSSVEINYSLFGWRDGDPRIVGMNMMAKLTDSPLIVRNIVSVATQLPQSDGVDLRSATIDDLCRRTLTSDSYATFWRSGNARNFITNKMLNVLGFPEQNNLFSLFSSVSGNGGELQKERISALESIGEIVNLKGIYLRVALQAYKEGVIDLDGIKQHASLTALLNKAKIKARTAFRTAYGTLRPLGVLYKDGGVRDTDMVKIDTLVEEEIESGMVFLKIYYIPEGHPPLRGTSTFIHPREGDFPRLRTPAGTFSINTFPSAIQQNVDFVDGTTEVLNHQAIMCPFPGYAARDRS